SYLSAGRYAEALLQLKEAMAWWQRRVAADEGNTAEASWLAWTHGQMGEAKQYLDEYAAAAQAYAKSVEMFQKLAHSGALKNPLFREKMAFYQKQLALCGKAEQAVRDLDFMLNQPAAEVPGLLGMRVRYLLKEQKLAAAAESAAKMKELAGDEPVQLYNAA